MELSAKRRTNRKTYNLHSLNNQFQDTNHNLTTVDSYEIESFVQNQSFEVKIIDEKVQAKASILMSLPISPRISAEKRSRDISKKEMKLSLMQFPKKKITSKQFADCLGKHKNESKIKLNKTLTNNFNPADIKHFHMPDNKQNDHLFNNTLNSLNRRNILHFFSPSEYFSLVFSKLLSKPGKEKIYVFIKQLQQRYLKYPEKISQDIHDMRCIATKLKMALDPTEQFIELRPFEALEVNGELARLVFYLTHEIACKKYRKNQLIKIQKQIQYGSRRLQFHRFTLRVCFQLGQLYKKQNDELNSHIYFTKALKMAIFLNDKFSEQKAIDSFGMAAYLANKSGQAHFYHQNSDKLFPYERDTIRQKYSNSDQIQKICQQRSYLIYKSSQNQRRECSLPKKQKFNFYGEEYLPNYELQNNRKFKKKIKQYIQSSEMRDKVLKARSRFNKIGEIGKVKRYKNWQASRIPHRFRPEEDGEGCTEVLLTHRSLNRVNPEHEYKIIEKQRRILLQLINYYTNDAIAPPE